MVSLIKEHNWCVDHPKELEKHPGKWIAVVEEDIVATENTYREAYEKAKQKFPEKIPLVTYVPREGEELLIV